MNLSEPPKRTGRHTQGSSAALGLQLPPLSRDCRAPHPSAVHHGSCSPASTQNTNCLSHFYVHTHNDPGQLWADPCLLWTLRERMSREIGLRVPWVPVPPCHSPVQPLCLSCTNSSGHSHCLLPSPAEAKDP